MRSLTSSFMTVGSLWDDILYPVTSTNAITQSTCWRSLAFMLSGLWRRPEDAARQLLLISETQEFTATIISLAFWGIKIFYVFISLFQIIFFSLLLCLFQTFRSPLVSLMFLKWKGKAKNSLLSRLALRSQVSHNFTAAVISLVFSSSHLTSAECLPFFFITLWVKNSIQQDYL